MKKFNLDSPNSISNPIQIDNLIGWTMSEIEKVDDFTQRDVLKAIVTEIHSFVFYAERALLLWPGCTREGKLYHKYPTEIKELSKKHSISLDTRSNGPAIASFLIAGGIRPQRFGSHNCWSIHHLYSGKFAYIGKNSTLHAVKSGDHFTFSAGLVAVHPIADAMCDEYPFFSWYLRALSFIKFKYDPDSVFK